MYNDIEIRKLGLNLIMDFYGETIEVPENYNREDITNNNYYMKDKHFMTALKCTLIHIEKQIETLEKVKQTFLDLSPKNEVWVIQSQIDNLKLIRYEIVILSIKIRSKNIDK